MLFVRLLNFVHLTPSTFFSRFCFPYRQHVMRSDILPAATKILVTVNTCFQLFEIAQLWWDSGGRLSHRVGTEHLTQVFTGELLPLKACTELTWCKRTSKIFLHFSTKCTNAIGNKMLFKYLFHETLFFKSFSNRHWWYCVDY